jgi:hypothetical protein
MYYALKIPALYGDYSLRHQFTYRSKGEENGQEWKNIWAVIEVRDGNAQIVSDGYHSRRKTMVAVKCFNEK